MSSTVVDAHEYRRWGPIGPLRLETGVRGTSPASAAKPVSTSPSWAAAWRGTRLAARSARSCSYGLRAIVASASAARVHADGAASGLQSSGCGAGGFGLVSRRTVMSSVPETPSTMLWWVLARSAQRLSPSPSTIQSSQSGLVRSSCWLITRPTSRRSSGSRPGAGSAV